MCGRPDVQVVAAVPNAASFDLRIGNQRLSIKTETGRGTHPKLITITKLCTTEKEPWTAQTLIERVMRHLSRYDYMLMLRALWPPAQPVVHYQLLEIPLDLLRRIGEAEIGPVGRREGRQSLAGNVLDNDGQVVFRVHFDAADGKCQVRNLPVDRCPLLREWDQRT